MSTPGIQGWSSKIQTHGKITQTNPQKGCTFSEIQIFSSRILNTFFFFTLVVNIVADGKKKKAKKQSLKMQIYKQHKQKPQTTTEKALFRNETRWDISKRNPFTNRRRRKRKLIHSAQLLLFCPRAYAPSPFVPRMHFQWPWQCWHWLSAAKIARTERNRETGASQSKGQRSHGHGPGGKLL